MRKDEPSKKHARKVEKDRTLGRSDTYAKPTPNFKRDILLIIFIHTLKRVLKHTRFRESENTERYSKS